MDADPFGAAMQGGNDPLGGMQGGNDPLGGGMDQPGMQQPQPGMQQPGGLQQPMQAPAAAPVPVQKQKLNIYTMMLLISFVAVVTSCILMYMELQRYGEQDWWKTHEARPTTPVSMIQQHALPSLYTATVEKAVC